MPVSPEQQLGSMELWCIYPVKLSGRNLELVFPYREDDLRKQF